MKNKIKFLNLILFILIFFVLLIIFGKILIPKKVSDIYYKNEVYYRDYDLDYIAAGCSEMNRGISPMFIWNDTGYTGYNIGASAERIYTTYYSLKSILKYQNPKYVFLSSELIHMTYPLNKHLLRENWERKPINEVNFEMLGDKIYNFDTYDYIHSIFPIFAYHQEWKHFGKIPSNHETRGHYVKAKSKVKKQPSDKDAKKYFKKTDKVKKINDINIEYLLKINKMLKEKNIKFVIVGMPNFQTYSYAAHNAIKEISEKNDITFLDFNEYMGKYNIDYRMDFEDKTHLNGLGAKKLSSFISDYLKSQGDLKDKRKDENFQNWNKDYKTYLKYYKKVTKNIKKNKKTKEVNVEKLMDIIEEKKEKIEKKKTKNKIGRKIEKVF